MADVMLACSDDDWDFDRPRVIDDMQRLWPSSTYSAEEGAVDTLGQLVVRDGDETALVELLTIPGGLGVEGDDRLVAEVLAALARTQPVPADGSLLALGWAKRAVPLTPATTAAGLMEAEPA
ncbi:hypothetical protein [Cellulomonas dongxiuzhuiae]|uniref:Uncharacterized protein n=1 Tax=Cellulomonas dongxiuzhuiae TaxID=2819979 RepID=A0ABX8GIV2_9CELL|nr:hypothetical protein [Cellulomonas dongxiuzhuiae]MBO3095134.1 hypothetical protein [Cellulomonas dongxiuzhuiae]QWC16139.1 hypothetical protein KKR89_00170 [Cellulomonas dongxiuzhuiae]